MHMEARYIAKVVKKKCTLDRDVEKGNKKEKYNMSCSKKARHTVSR